MSEERNTEWEFSTEIARTVASKVYETLGMMLTDEELHNLGYAIYLQLCKARNERE